MKMIEMHIIQSFPVTCLNRDDLGSPKSAVFGGVERARVSSQCWKRAIRMNAKELHPDYYKGKRGHYMAEKMLVPKLIEKGMEPSKAKEIGEQVAGALANGSNKYKPDEKTDAATYYSPMQVEKIATALITKDLTVSVNNKKEVSLKGKKVSEIIGEANDLVDISLFGRMVANDHSLMLEGAANFSHAISTHKVSSEIDFFSAVDDLKPEDSEGAGHIGTLEFNSACYYRYIGINLDLLFDKDKGHLKHFNMDERKKVLDAFIKACLMANPIARKNSMFGYSFPSFVLGLRRTGQPLSLANAFEKPIKASSEGYTENSITELKKYFEFMKKTWNITTDVKMEIPALGVDKFIESLLNSEV